MKIVDIKSNEGSYEFERAFCQAIKEISPAEARYIRSYSHTNCEGVSAAPTLVFYASDAGGSRMPFPGPISADTAAAIAWDWLSKHKEAKITSGTDETKKFGWRVRSELDPTGLSSEAVETIRDLQEKNQALIFVSTYLFS